MTKLNIPKHIKQKLSLYTDDAYFYNARDKDEYGEKAAVFLNKLRYFIEAQKENKSKIHLHEGRYWCWNTQEAWQSMIRCTRQEIRTIVDKLSKSGLLLSSYFESNMDGKCLWYTTSEEWTLASNNMTWRIYSVMIDANTIRKYECLEDNNISHDTMKWLPATNEMVASNQLSYTENTYIKERDKNEPILADLSPSNSQLNKSDTDIPKSTFENQIMQTWNTVSKNSGIKLPEARGLTPLRIKQIEKTSKMLLKTLDDWEQYFYKVIKSDFLTGNVKSSRPFQANFNWVIKYDNALKVLEGNYDNSREIAKEYANKPYENTQVKTNIPINHPPVYDPSKDKIDKVESVSDETMDALKKLRIDFERRFGENTGEIKAKEKNSVRRLKNSFNTNPLSEGISYPKIE